MKKTKDLSKKLFIEEFEQPTPAWLGYRLTSFSIGEETGVTWTDLTEKVEDKG